MTTLSLELIKGYDKNGTPFSAFLLCTEEDSKKFNKITETTSQLDLHNARIIYKMIGHVIDPQIVDNILGYIDKNPFLLEEETVELSGSDCQQHI